MEYGPLKIDRKRRELLVGGTPVSIGTRAYEIAHLLVEAGGELVSKDEIMRRVWPGTIVEESNIPVAVSALRKALGEHAGTIQTVAGQGYRLVNTAPTFKITTHVPTKTKSFVGREGVVQDLERLLNTHSIVTLTGAGGMGKTCLALETARELMPLFRDGVANVELASVVDSRMIPHAVASALGLKLPDSLARSDRIASLVASRNLLLVMDNCEHLVDEVAHFAHTVVLPNPNLRILATSREPLRIGGEAIYRVSPLSVPPDDVKGSDRLLRYGAVQLFVERTRAMASDFVFDEESFAAAALICRRLDGIPLAIEIAASRAATLGVVELSRRLDDQFRLMTSNFRTTLPRHRTLQATFDWSYNLLTPAEQRGLQRLAIAVGRHTLDMAKTLLSDGREPVNVSEEILAGLVEKSLVVAEVVRGRMRYRLLATTRSYAFAKLQESGELDQVARQHAECWLGLLATAELDWQGHAQPGALHDLEDMDPLGNARAAIDWAFSPKGDAALGLSLTIAAVPVWMHLAMASECHRYVGRALEVLAANPKPNPDLEMRLRTAYGLALLSTMEASNGARRAFQRALEIAEQLSNRDYLIRNLWGLCFVCLNEGDFRAAQEVVGRFHELASTTGDPGTAAWANLLLGGVESVLGDLDSARRHAERALELCEVDTERSPLTRFHFNPRALSLGLLGSVLWQQGHGDQCKRKLEESVAEAMSHDHLLALPNTLANWVCSVLLVRGDLDDAERYTTVVVEHASRYGLGFWLLWARCFRGALATKRGHLKEGLGALRTSFAELFGADNHPRFTFLRALYANALYQAGEDAEALTVAEQALQAAERRGHLSMMPEFLRIKACVLAHQPDARMHQEADRILRSALDLACRQGSLSRQLRVAISLVRLRRANGPAEDALSILRDTYGQFREGFETADLREARALLESG